jgi:two-component system phosphate regulon sensor histidine kinase PhoR
MIREESAKLGAHVERILQIAVIDQGDMKLAVDPVDVHDVVSRLATAYHLRLQRPDDSLVTSLRAEHSIVRGDPMHISNMIDNLLDNAVKYSKPDRIDVVVSTRNEGDTLVLEVTDQGVGMKKDTTKRIFEKFYRVPTGNVHNIKGFGLGLSYVKYVVEAHQGTISVKSSPDHGSTFKITIPI